MAPAVVACRTALSSLQTASAGLSDGGIWTLGGIPRPLHRLSTWQCRSGLPISSVDRRRRKLHPLAEVRDGPADCSDGGDGGTTTVANCNPNMRPGRGGGGGGGGGAGKDKRRRRFGRYERCRFGDGGDGGSSDARDCSLVCSSSCACSSSSDLVSSEEQEEEEEGEEEEVQHAFSDGCDDGGYDGCCEEIGGGVFRRRTKGGESSVSPAAAMADTDLVVDDVYGFQKTMKKKTKKNADVAAPRSSSDFFLQIEPGLQKVPLRVPIKLLGKLAMASLLAAPLLDYVFPKMASAAVKTLAQSSLGQHLAASLRSSNWPDGAIIFLISMLPVLELRGAIPVGYWMGLDPLVTVPLSVVGNMVPVPIILLYLGKLSSFLIEKSDLAARFFDFLFDHTREKAGPIAEFKWLGLMLFVAVPLPGTGAWSGAIAAHILGIPFWDAMSANFVGVFIAGLIMNMFCTVGLRQAIVVGIGLFILSSGIWNVLRLAKKKFDHAIVDEKDTTAAA